MPQAVNLPYLPILSTSFPPHLGHFLVTSVMLDSDVFLKGILFYLDFLYDLWTNYTVDENMKKEIFKKGVVVYERE